MENKQISNKISKKNLNFNNKESILYFQGKSILIAKSKNTNPHYLLKTIFTKKTHLWNYDEIAENWKEEYNSNSWKKFYNASCKINEKVAKKTTINNFLKPTKTAVKINKKYL